MILIIIIQLEKETKYIILIFRLFYYSLIFKIKN
jgi:hypothetical protein